MAGYLLAKIKPIYYSLVRINSKKENKILVPVHVDQMRIFNLDIPITFPTIR